ncbi:MAG: hypothetical protein MUE80_03080 [Acidobacteria bacterium]|jgi:hypothetical protein|nr:hypothetical protein [Acidobacteriota bacterium]
MKRTIAGWALLAALAAGLGAGTADRAALAKKQSDLASEYTLAKDPNFYFVFDVAGRKLELRVRGMVLRTWPLGAIRFWGRPDLAGPVELVKKTTLKAPERIVIKPGEEEALVKAPAPETKPAPAKAAPATAGDFDLEALELRDMPKRFSLDFDNGLHVTIKSRDAGAGGPLKKLAEAWRWYVALPLENLFGSREGRPVSELELTFSDGKDAQSIYWHFFDGIKGLIL